LGLMGLVLALGFIWRMPKEQAIFFTFAVNVIAAALIFGLAVFLQGVKPKEVLAEYMDQQIQEIEHFYEETEADPQQRMAISEALGRAKKFVLRGYPGLYAAMTLLLVALNFVVIRMVLVRLRYPVADRLPFTHLVVPEVWVWGVIVAMAMWLLGAGTVKVVGMNLGLVFIAVYFLQGLAIVTFLLKKIQVPGILQLVGFFLILVQPVLLLLVAGLGLFDIWLDLRRLKAST